jgi:hypothetical protein
LHAAIALAISGLSVDEVVDGGSTTAVLVHPANSPIDVTAAVTSVHCHFRTATP